VIQAVPAGDLGLDVLLGGGFRLVKRLPETPSATVLVRGGAGAGKTLVGLHAALELASALGGDVAVGCVEILPSEYVAQMRSARPGIDEGRIALLPERARSMSGPRVYCGLLTELNPETPDLVASLEALGREVEAAGGKARVFVVDSLIEGYGLGASVPRAGADAVMKFAAQGGYGLVLCEETHGAAASPWVFAADTVIELGVDARERGRWLEVRKHRFGPSVSGRHELDLDGGAQVFPEPHAWVARDLHEVLPAHGWAYRDRAGIPALVWESPLAPTTAPGTLEPPLEGAFVVIASQVSGVARSLAYGLRPAASAAPGPHSEAPVLLIELDPLVVGSDVGHQEWGQVCHLPTVHGPARALRRLVEEFARSFDPERRTPSVARVVIGDLRSVLSAPDALVWVEAVRVFASLVIASRWGIPVTAFTSGPERAPLATHADLTITATQPTQAQAVQRWGRGPHILNWSQPVTSFPLALDRQLRQPGRTAG
jgi:KaiC/GvpD/RAD55 family RecA-like ATPase